MHINAWRQKRLFSLYRQGCYCNIKIISLIRKWFKLRSIYIYTRQNWYSCVRPRSLQTVSPHLRSFLSCTQITNMATHAFQYTFKETWSIYVFCASEVIYYYYLLFDLALFTLDWDPSARTREQQCQPAPTEWWKWSLAPSASETPSSPKIKWHKITIWK